MLRYLIILFAISFQFSILSAQIWLSNEDIFNEAEEYRQAEDYIEALPLYQLLEKKGLGNAKISYKIGECFLNIQGKKDKALPYLKEAAQNISSESKDETFEEQRAPLRCLLLLGVAYRLQNDLENAIYAFNTLKDSVKDSNPELLSVIDMHISRCRNAKNILPYPAEYRPQKLPATINNQNSNIHPMVTSDESVIYYMEILPFYDALMRSELIERDEWTTPENITPQIGSDGDHILVGISSDGNSLLLYEYESLFNGEIFETKKGKNGWSKIKKVEGEVNSKYHEAHASLSSDGNTMYFTSNRPGGMGGMDIYEINKDEDGIWKNPKNMGSHINTPFNEEAPYISDDNKRFYFSSQGHLNIGGYDYFVSEYDEVTKDWKEPLNMGSPYSTTDDDVLYFPVGDGSGGYLARMNEGQSDIYRFELLKPARPHTHKIFGNVKYPDNTDTTEVEITVFEKNSNDTVSIFSSDENGYFEGYLPEGDFYLNYYVGEYKVQEDISISLDAPSEPFEIETTLEHKLLAEKDITTDDALEKHITDIDADDTGKMDEGTDEDAFIEKDTIRLKRIYFAFDSYKVGDEYELFMNEIIVIQKKYEQAELIITGHTDNVGSEQYNLLLSEKRANAVKKYLEEKGIDGSRIKVISKGEIRPVAVNTSSQGRSYNRRAEIIFKNLEDVLIIIPASAIPEDMRIKP